MSKIKTENNTTNLLLFFYKNRKKLFITGIVSGIVSIIISLLLPVLYESNAIVFPAATNTVSFSQRNAKSGVMDFGTESEAEQLLQVLESQKLRGRIIEKFDLAKVYEIDPNDNNFNYKLKNKYDERINFRRTRYGSINISVSDKSPQLAADIANAIVELIDTLMNELIKERTVPAFEINKRKLQQLQLQLDQLNNEIDSLAKIGVVDEKSRSFLFMSISESKNTEERNYIKKQIEINNKYGSKFDALSNLRLARIEKLSNHEVFYEQAESDATENFIHKFVVEAAFPSDKKSKPKRAIIVLVFTASAVILMLISLLIKERIKEIKLAE